MQNHRSVVNDMADAGNEGKKPVVPTDKNEVFEYFTGSREVTSANALSEEDKNDITPFNDTVYATLVQGLKEFVAVVTYALCFARLGVWSFDNPAFGIFMSLVVFNFPFMSPYLLTYVYSAMAWNAAFKTAGKPFWFGSWFRRASISMKVVFLIGVQLFGAAMAAYWRKYMIDTWGKEELDSEALNGLRAWKITKGVKHGLRDVCDSENEMFQFWVLEEWFAVMLFLIGLTHILEYHKTTKGFVQRAPENGASEASDSTPDTDKRYNRKFLPTPTPVSAIFYICVFVAAMTRMFPTAHFSFSVTLYLHVLQKLVDDTGTVYIDYAKNECLYRLIGGCLGTLFAWLYFAGIYRLLPTYKWARIFRANPQLFSKANDNLNPKYAQLLRL